MADKYVGGAAVLAWIAGIVSVLSTLVAGVNSQARMLFDGGRNGLLPAPARSYSRTIRHAGHCSSGHGGVGLGIIGLWWVSHLISGDTGSMDPVGLYAECSTMGTIVILFVYFLTMLSLPIFMWRRHKASFSFLRHAMIPALGSLSSSCPSLNCASPGSPPHITCFRIVALVIVAVAVIIGFLVVHLRPHAGEGEGATFSGA